MRWGQVYLSQLATKKTVLIAGIIGFLSGMTPDLDIFIRSDADPLLFLRISPAIYPLIIIYTDWWINLRQLFSFS